MSLFQTAVAALMFVLSLSLGAAVWRLLRGPSIPDRTTALDLIVNHIVGLVAMFVIISGQVVLIDVVIVISVLGFLGTVAIARFIEVGRS